MILGTGIDIIEVSRIQSAIQKEGFVSRVYTEAEWAYICARNKDPQVAAGIFSAKEAVAKALGCGFSGIGWRDIEILRDDRGRPYTILHDRAYSVMQSLGGSIVHVSITHLKGVAAANAIFEG